MSAGCWQRRPTSATAISWAADGGSVYLTAAAAADMAAGLINMTGTIQANSVGEQDGRIILFAEGSNAVTGNVETNKGKRGGNSTVLVSGTISAQGKDVNEKGGSVDVLADHTGILTGASIDASGKAGGGKILWLAKTPSGWKMVSFFPFP